ncbi:MAG: DUF302 domain-containing protein [Deltaproteobacteria bacterium]|nr:DUF302 domain-containing protein [Deltaproteobacteria bacterium]
MIESAYGIKRHSPHSYEETITKVTESLKQEGFGVLTEIDVKATLKKKIDKDFTKYIILGACNPPLAFSALTSEIDIGLLLPCNVVVYENPKDGKVIVAAVDPMSMLQVTGRKDLGDFADEVKAKLTRAINAV